MEYVVAGIVGILIALIIMRLVDRQKPVGDLRIDHSDPDSPYLFLELNIGMDELSKMKEVVLRVKMKDYISRK